MIKAEIVFDKYYETWEKVSSIIKKEFNSKLVYNKKYLKAEKKSTQKKAFNVILTVSVYKKDENYYSKVFLEKYNFNDSYNVWWFCWFWTPMKKIQMMKIRFISLFFKKDNQPDQQSSRNAWEHFL